MWGRATLAVALLCATVHAEELGDPTQLARAHAEAGRVLYNAGSYREAIREFQAGYELVPKPQFLINLGQAYRKLGELESARDMFGKFLIDAPPDAPERVQIKRIYDALVVEVGTRPSPAPEPPQPSAEPPPVAPPEITPAPAAPPPAPPPTTTAAASPAQLIATPAPPKKSFIKRHWWIFPVAGAVVVGVAIGAYFGSRSPDSCPVGATCTTLTW